MWKVREAAAEKALNQFIDTQLWYTLSNIYQVKLTTCAMKRKTNGYVELICFQTPLFPHPFLRVQITPFPMLIFGLGLNPRSGSHL